MLPFAVQQGWRSCHGWWGWRCRWRREAHSGVQCGWNRLEARRCRYARDASRVRIAGWLDVCVFTVCFFFNLWKCMQKVVPYRAMLVVFLNSINVRINWAIVMGANVSGYPRYLSDFLPPRAQLLPPTAASRDGRYVTWEARREGMHGSRRQTRHSE